MKMRSLCFLAVAAMTLFFAGHVLAADYSGKKILLIDSYHEGYPWSEGIVQGVKSVIAGSGAGLRIERMDSKRNDKEEYKKKVAGQIKQIILTDKPDVVIAADDNASKYVIVPFFKNTQTPVVFCGINWDASEYGYPCDNVTGMLEVTPVFQIIAQLKPFAKGNRIGFLGPDTLTSKKEGENIKNALEVELIQYFAINSQDWKKGFAYLQEHADLVLLDSDGGLYADQAQDLKAFALENVKVPTGSGYDFMAPYALITYSKMPEEQGKWAAQTALKILDGTSPGNIPVVQNKEGELIINEKIASRLGLKIPNDLLQKADRVIE